MTNATTLARIEESKKKMLEALNETMGIVSVACKRIGIVRSTHYEWYKNDPEYKEAVDDIKEYRNDFVESMIIKKIKDGDTTMTIFYAKTQMKERGYSERVEVTGADGKDLISEDMCLKNLSKEERDVLLKIGTQILNNKE